MERPISSFYSYITALQERCKLKGLIITIFLFSLTLIHAEVPERSSQVDVSNRRFKIYSGKALTRFMIGGHKARARALTFDRTSTIYFVLNNNEESMMVELGPKWFLERKGIDLRKNYNVIVRGHEVRRKTSSKIRMIVTQKIVINNQMFVLRNERGVPEWLDY